MATPDPRFRCTSSSPGTGLELSGRAPSTVLGSQDCCVVSSCGFSDVWGSACGQVLPLLSCWERIEEQQWELLLSVHLPGSWLCMHHWELEVVSRFKSPCDRTKGHPGHHSQCFCKEWGEKTTPGLVSPRADISISQTPLAALSSPGVPAWSGSRASLDLQLQGELSLPGRAPCLITATAIRCHKSIRSLLFPGG